MSTALTTAKQQQDQFDQAEVLAAIKQTVARGATDAQLKMFIEVCRSTGLNPWLREIWYVAEKGIIMAARDGYLRVANENPNFDGMETRVERDKANIPIKAVCTVWRKDRTHPVVCEAYFNEYKSGSPVWTKYPSAMVSKVAEVLALKRSFSINGCVTEEEIGEQGSAAAAQDVAQQKIAAMERAKAAGRSVVEAPLGIDAPPIIDAEVVDPEQEIHDEIFNALSRSQRKVSFDKFKMLPAIALLKKRFLALNNEAAYRRILKRCGVEKSNQFTDDNNGLLARVAYKEMQMVLSEIEPQIPEVDKLPDAVEQVEGTTLRCGGKVWAAKDGEFGHTWIEVVPA